MIRTHCSRGLLLIQAVVAFFLIFTVGVASLGVMSSAERNQSHAAQVRVAVQMARDGLESVRSGVVKASPGQQRLTSVNCRIGKTSVQFQPEIQVESWKGLLLVRSRILWSEGRRNHRVEVKCLVSL